MDIPQKLAVLASFHSVVKNSPYYLLYHTWYIQVVFCRFPNCMMTCLLSINIVLPLPFASTVVLAEDTAVYPMYEILGWYTVGTEATEEDLRIQRQVSTCTYLQQCLEPNPLSACARCVQMYRYMRGKHAFLPNGTGLGQVCTSSHTRTKYSYYSSTSWHLAACILMLIFNSPLLCCRSVTRWCYPIVKCHSLLAPRTDCKRMSRLNLTLSN